MVSVNSIQPEDGNASYDKIKRPRQYLFKMGAYKVSFHTREYSPSRYSFCAVWHENKVIGTIDLSTTYEDAQSIVSVDTKIKTDYQGLDIGYRTYEALVADVNMGLHSSNQSQGAIKLWRKFASNDLLKLYFIDDVYSSLFFQCRAFDVRMKNDNLQGVDYSNRGFDPYKRKGSLLLVNRNGSLDKIIQEQRPLHKAQQRFAVRFKKNDRWVGIKMP